MNSAVLLCGGSSSRFSVNKNKLLHKINGVEVAKICFDTLFEMKDIDHIVVVRKKGDRAVERLFEGRSKVIFAEGGASRFMSVRNGLKMCPSGTEIAVIHDGARPFVTSEVIKNSIKSAKKYGSGVTAIEVVDTLRKVEKGILQDVVDRSEVVRIQTPQTFNFEEISKAYEMAFEEFGEENNFTDDSSVYSKYVGKCKMVFGNRENEKITYREDVLREFNAGIGYDIHRLVENRDLILCGVKIPFDKGLLGHSDADAPLHALMDAILSSIGKKDIGHYFPVDDDKFLNASSLKLLENVMEILTEEGKKIVNVAISIIAEAPKLAPYIDEMKGVLGEVLNIPTSSVGITVTTNEGIDLIGEGKGIGAFATVSVSTI